MKVTIIEPFGYCTGVNLAINEAVNAAKNAQGENIYCINPIVHNDLVNQYLLSLNIKTLYGNINDLIDSIDSGIVIFSAHGTDSKLIQKASKKNLKVINTICPFVKKSHELVNKYLNDDYDIVFIGKRNHPETIAILSISDKIHLIENKEDIDNLSINNSKIIVFNQTTISITSLKDIYDSLKEKFHNILFIDEICNATRIRQEKVNEISKENKSIIVIGDKMSNNSKSLYDIAISNNKNTIMVNSFDQIDINWLKNQKDIVLVSGTSTPNDTVLNIYNKILNL